MRINSNDTSFKAYFKPNNQLKRIFSSKSAIDIIANHEIACPQTGIRSLRRKYPHQELEILDNYNIFNNTTGNLLQLSELNIDLSKYNGFSRMIHKLNQMADAKHKFFDENSVEALLYRTITKQI